MDEDHLQASASQEHNPDMSCCENWVPAYGTKVGDLNWKANHAMDCADAEPSA